MKILFLLTTMVFQSAFQAPSGVSGAVSGRIQDRDGSPAAKVRVAAMLAQDQLNSVATLMAFALTDSSGLYRIENIEPGTYYITAGLAAQPTYYPGVAAEPGARKITVTAGAAISGIDFKMVTPLADVRGARGAPPPAPAAPVFTTVNLSGRVVLQPGQQLPTNAKVSLSSGIAGAIKPDGSFELTGVRSGSHSLRTNLSLFLPPVDVLVTDKNVTGLDLAIPLAVRVTISVSVEDGRAPVPIALIFRSVANPENGVSVSSSRPFTMDLPEGTYRVSAEGIPSGYYVKSIAAGPANLLTEPLKISRADVGRQIVVTLGIAAAAAPARPLRELSGRVAVDGDRPGPVVGLRFSAISGAGGMVAMVMADSSVPGATFKVALPDGEYKVEAFFPRQPSGFRVKALTYGSSDLTGGSLRVTAESAEVGIVLGITDPLSEGRDN